MKRFSYLIMLMFFGLYANAQNNGFEQGNNFYNNADYEEAIKAYQSVLDAGQQSAELYFNMGNAHYKLNHIASSIFYYEKALQLSPNDPDIKNNLSYAQNMTIDAISPLPQLGISRYFKQVVNVNKYDAWAKLSIVFMVLFVVLVLIYFFSETSNAKRLGFIGGFTSLSLCIVFLAFAFKKFDFDAKDHPAIVFARETMVRTDPNLGGETLFILHEGTKVQVLDSVNNWKKIKIADGKSGWIVGEDIRLLEDF